MGVLGVEDVVEGADLGQVTAAVAVPSSGVGLTRTTSVDGPSARVEMTARNGTDRDLKITFGEPPCFPRSLFAGGTLELPSGSVGRTGAPVQPRASMLSETVEFPWAAAVARSGEALDLSSIPLMADGRHDHASFRIAEESVNLRGPDAEVRLRWDVDAMPHLLLWEHFRPEGSMWNGDVFGVEPVTSSVRTMDDADRTQTLRTLERVNS